MTQTLLFVGDRCSPPLRGRVSFDQVELKQGLNEITDDAAIALKEHPDYARYERWKAIEWIEPITETALPGELPRTLGDYSVEAAQKLIAVCMSEDVLKLWLENERRTTLVRSINRRISEVRGGE